jgi:hypothetical protein
MRNLFLLILITFFSIKLVGQQKPSNALIDSLKKMISFRMIPKILETDTILKELNINQIKDLDIKIYPRYEIIESAKNFKKGDNVINYLSLLNNNFNVILQNNKILQKPIYLWINKESNKWEYSKNSKYLFKSFQLCDSIFFDVIGLFGYWYFKNDSLNVYLDTEKRTIGINEYLSNSNYIDMIHNAAYATAYRYNKINKEEFENISDSIWIQSIKNKNRLDSLNKVKK